METRLNEIVTCHKNYWLTFRNLKRTLDLYNSASASDVLDRRLDVSGLVGMGVARYSNVLHKTLVFSVNIS